MENVLAMPVVKGRKTDKEKFSGAEATYTVECMMHDKKALQGGTSHYFGDGFARAFGITFTGKDNQPHFPHQTSWGVSTRMIGGIIMTHGDNNGLVLPPRVAPIQVVIIPVAQHKPGVLEANAAVMDRLVKAGFRVKMDDFRAVPRLEVRRVRDEGRAPAPGAGPQGPGEEPVRAGPPGHRREGLRLLGRHRADRGRHCWTPSTTGCTPRLERIWKKTPIAAYSLEEAKAIQEEKGGFIKTMWCGDLECELKMKEEAGVSSRCIPFEQEHLSDVCPICGKPAKHMIYWGVAY